MHARLTEMAEQIVVAVGETGYVTRQSRTPRSASGTFVPPLASAVTPRRSSRLMAKRRLNIPSQARVPRVKTVSYPFLRLIASYYLQHKLYQRGPNWVVRPQRFSSSCIASGVGQLPGRV